MRKLLSALFLVLCVVSFSNCSLFTGINKDPMAAAVVNAISESKLDNKVYCDNSGYFMVYYWNGQNGIQVGLAYQVPSIQNGAPTEAFIKDVKNIQKKLPKEFKEMQIHYRMYIYTSSKTYFYGSIFMDKNKEYHYSNENNRNTYLEGKPFASTVSTFGAGIFSEYKYQGWQYTENIIY